MNAGKSPIHQNGGMQFGQSPSFNSMFPNNQSGVTQISSTKADFGSSVDKGAPNFTSLVDSLDPPNGGESPQQKFHHR